MDREELQEFIEQNCRAIQDFRDSGCKLIPETTFKRGYNE